MSVTKRDLVTAWLEDDSLILHCRQCGLEASATPGDYFQIADDHVFVCCDQPMVLGAWHSRFVQWRKPEGGKT